MNSKSLNSIQESIFDSLDRVQSRILGLGKGRVLLLQTTVIALQGNEELQNRGQNTVFSNIRNNSVLTSVSLISRWPINHRVRRVLPLLRHLISQYQYRYLYQYHPLRL